MDITNRCCNGEYSASAACLGHSSGIGGANNLVFNLVWDFLFFAQLFSQSKQFTVHKSTFILEAEHRTLAQSADLLARRYAGNIRCTIGIDCYCDVRLNGKSSSTSSSADLFSGRKDDGHIVFQRLTEQVQQQQAADAVVQCLCTDAAAHLNKGRTEGCKVARLSKLQCVLAVFRADVDVQLVIAEHRFAVGSTLQMNRFCSDNTQCAAFQTNRFADYHAGVDAAHRGKAQQTALFDVGDDEANFIHVC